MFFKIRMAFSLWTMQMKGLLHNQVIDLDPHEYCIGAVFVIAIGFVLLNGRK